MSAPRPLDGRRVLFVDDDADIRKMFRTVLESAGAIVLDAATLAEVNALLGETAVDALVLDWHLAGDSPAEWLRSVDARRPGLAARVLVVSGDPRVIGRGATTLPQGVRALAKPFRPGELVAALAKLLAEQPAR